MSRSVKDLGLYDDHMEFLTHMAHQFHGPTDFDDEVQKHLDRLYTPPTKGVESLESPEDKANAISTHQDQAISNLSQGESSNILSTPKHVKLIPSTTPPPSAENLS